jgi:hypothetical protein
MESFFPSFPSPISKLSRTVVAVEGRQAKDVPVISREDVVPNVIDCQSNQALAGKR